MTDTQSSFELRYINYAWRLLVISRMQNHLLVSIQFGRCHHGARQNLQEDQAVG